MEPSNAQIPYKEIDDFKYPIFFSTKCILSALKYKPKNDDVFIATYPKCGTTWLQNIVLNILRKGKALEHPRDLYAASPFLDMLGAEDATRLMLKPGLLKTHLPFNKVPWSDEAKYICVVRNPKDCAISYYHHMRELPPYNFRNGKFDTFLDCFLKGEIEYGDYFDHVTSWYNQRHRPNIYFAVFENMKKDLHSTIMGVAKFLGEEYFTLLNNNPDTVHQIMETCKIETMREFFNPFVTSLYDITQEDLTTNKHVPEGRRHVQEYTLSLALPKASIQFIKNGNTGNWKVEMTQEQNEMFDQWITQKTKDTDVMELWKELM